MSKGKKIRYVVAHIRGNKNTLLTYRRWIKTGKTEVLIDAEYAIHKGYKSLKNAVVNKSIDEKQVGTFIAIKA